MRSESDTSLVCCICGTRDVTVAGHGLWRDVPGSLELGRQRSDAPRMSELRLW